MNGPSSRDDDVWAARPVLIARPPHGARWLGSGVTLSEGVILTALHVLKDCTEVRVRLDGEDRFRTARRVWPSESSGGAPDAAVLHVDGVEPGVTALSRLRGEPLQPHTLWDASGFPMVRDGSPSRDLQTVQGKCLRYRLFQERLQLNVDVSMDQWRGVSGAGVIVEDRVAGIVASYEEGHENNKKLDATPVALLLRDPAFVCAVCADAAARHARALEQTEAEIRERLNRAPELVEVLASALDVPPESIAHHLVFNLEAGQIATALERAISSLPKGQAGKVARDVLRQIALWALGAAVDLRELVQRVAADDVRGAIALPVRRASIAEMVMAGAELRPCRLNVVGPDERGARVTVDGAAEPPVYLDQGVSMFASEQTVREGLALSLSAVFRELGPVRDASDFLALVQGVLEDEAFDRIDDPRRYYLVLVDADFMGSAADFEDRASLDDWWALLKSVAAAEVDALRLLRLTGGPTEGRLEMKVENRLKRVLWHLDPDGRHG